MNPKIMLGAVAFIAGFFTVASNAEREEEKKYNRKTARVREKYECRAKEYDDKYDYYRSRF